jgi:hypothetical protein
LEATGDYVRAKKLLNDMAKLRPEVQKAIDSLQAVPTDIEPRFVTADALGGTKMPAKSAKAKKK